MTLTDFKNIEEIPLSNLTKCGIYILCYEGDIVYIGQSVCAYARLSQYLRFGLKQFDKVYFIPCSEANLSGAEYTLIRLFKPKLNVRSGKFKHPDSKKDSYTTVLNSEYKEKQIEAAVIELGFTF